jgi:hypothetical protein
MVSPDWPSGLDHWHSSFHPGCSPQEAAPPSLRTWLGSTGRKGETFKADDDERVLADPRHPGVVQTVQAVEVALDGLAPEERRRQDGSQETLWDVVDHYNKGAFRRWSS